VQLRARDGRALLAGEAASPSDDGWREVDPHSLALGGDLADALHEWARVADAVHRNGQEAGTAAARLISRRGQQLATRLAGVMGRPVSYADPLTGEVTEVSVPEPLPADEEQQAGWMSSHGRHRAADIAPVPTEPPPWATGLTISFVTAVLMMIVVITLSLALGAANRWLPLIANVVIAIGLAPSVWLARRALVWRWVAFGIVAGIVIAWIALLFTAL
jgi:hypothetical protein